MRSYSFTRPLAGPALAGLFAAFLVAPAMAQTGNAGSSQYEQHRAYCQQMSNQVDIQACMREAGAAAQERAKRNGLTVPSEAERQANALRRCERLPEAHRADCVRLRSSTDARTQGSVTGGGVYRELRTMEYGEPVVVPVDRAPATAPTGVMVVPPTATQPHPHNMHPSAPNVQGTGVR